MEVRHTHDCTTNLEFASFLQQISPVFLHLTEQYVGLNLTKLQRGVPGFDHRLKALTRKMINPKTITQSKHLLIKRMIRHLTLNPFLSSSVRQEIELRGLVLTEQTRCLLRENQEYNLLQESPQDKQRKKNLHIQWSALHAVSDMFCNGKS